MITIQYFENEWLDYIELNIEEPILDNILIGNYTPTNIVFNPPNIGRYNGVYGSLNEFIIDMFNNYSADWRYVII